MTIKKPDINPSFAYGPIISYELNGNISRDRNKYRFRYTLTFKSGYVFHTQKSGFKTAHDAEKARELTLIELAQNRYVPFHYSVSEFFDYWLYQYQIEERHIAYNTYKSYHNVMYNYLLPSFGKDTKIETLQLEDIQNAVSSIPYESLKVNAAYVMKNIMESAFQKKCIPVRMCIYPTIILQGKRIKSRKRDVSLSVEQIKEILCLAKQEYSQLFLPILLSLVLGTRISETIGIRYSDIDFTARKIYIQRQLGRSLSGSDSEFLVSSPIDTKTPNGVRAIPTPEWVLDEIIVQRANYQRNRQHIEDFHDLDYVCCKNDGSPFHRKSFSRDFTKLRERLGLTDFHWHDFRHVYATTLRNNSINMKAISEYMGHSTPEFTEDVYVTAPMVVYDCTPIQKEWDSLRPKPAVADVFRFTIPFTDEWIHSLLGMDTGTGDATLAHGNSPKEAK